jgi:hypothetical protein
MRSRRARRGEWDEDRESPPAPPRVPAVARALALQRAAGNTATARVLARAPGDTATPLLLTDRPWAEIEAERGARAKAAVLGPEPWLDTGELRLPITIGVPPELMLPEPAAAPLLLTDRPWAEIEAERQRLRDKGLRAPGEYQEPSTASYEGDALSGGGEAVKLAARQSWERYMNAVKRLGPADQGHPEFKRLVQRARTTWKDVKGDTSAVADWDRLVVDAEAVVSWAERHLREKAERQRHEKAPTAE